ncbi:helix-turn-helix domain-containing protein [Latilactobacillus curvatus]
MLRNNLAVLLSERQIRISKLSNDTGISRTTLTALSTNSSKMVQVETINKICQALNITPSSFFEYIPFDFNFFFDIGPNITDPAALSERRDPIPTFESTLIINVLENNIRINTIELSGYTEDYGIDPNNKNCVGIGLRPTNEQELSKLNTYIKDISVAFESDIKKDIQKFVQTSLNKSWTYDVVCEVLVELHESNESPKFSSNTHLVDLFGSDENK